MATKTFKIGEQAIGGVIVASIDKTKIEISVRNWDTSAGYNRGSSQKNAKEIEHYTFYLNESNLYRNLFMKLTDITTAYFTDNIIEWLESKADKKIKSLF